MSAGQIRVRKPTDGFGGIIGVNDGHLRVNGDDGIFDTAEDGLKSAVVFCPFSLGIASLGDVAHDDPEPVDGGCAVPAGGYGYLYDALGVVLSGDLLIKRFLRYTRFKDLIIDLIDFGGGIAVHIFTIVHAV